MSKHLFSACADTRRTTRKNANPLLTANSPFAPSKPIETYRVSILKVRPLTVLECMVCYRLFKNNNTISHRNSLTVNLCDIVILKSERTTGRRHYVTLRVVNNLLRPPSRHSSIQETTLRLQTGNPFPCWLPVTKPS